MNTNSTFGQLNKRSLWTALSLLLALSLVLSACAAQVVSAAEEKDSKRPSWDPKPRIALESAFDAELQLLLAQTAKKKAQVINGCTYTTGELMGKDVVLFLTCGGSMYNSALYTQLAFDRFNITALLFSGIAGGIDPSLNIGDVVIGERSAEYLEMLAARETSPGVYEPPAWFTPDPPSNFLFMFPQPNFAVPPGGEPDKAEPIRWFPADPELVQIAQNAVSDIQLKQCGQGQDGSEVCLSTQPKVVKGNLVMGPWYMDNAAMRSWVYEQFNAQALAMEEILHACYVQRPQKRCLMLRSLSDLAGGGQGENEILTFFRIAADNSALVLMEILKDMPSAKELAR
jgi:adenosylhomocysteine nucleosidase